MGQVRQITTVEGEPVVDVQSVETSTTFDQQLLQDIPAGRDPWSTVAQVPGVTSSTFDVGGNQSAAGQFRSSPIIAIIRSARKDSPPVAVFAGIVGECSTLTEVRRRAS